MDTRPRTSLISFCTVQLRTLCAAHSLATLRLCTTSGPGPGELPGFWGSMVFRHAPVPRKGPGNQQQQYKKSSKLLVPSWGFYHEKLVERNNLKINFLLCLLLIKISCWLWLCLLKAKELLAKQFFRVMILKFCTANQLLDLLSNIC